MINEQITRALRPSGVPAFYKIPNSKPDCYILFKIYNGKESLFVDDRNLGEKEFITLKFWYKNLKDLIKFKEIKDLMKSNGFSFDGYSDLTQDGDYMGKELDFIIENLEESETII